MNERRETRLPHPDPCEQALEHLRLLVEEGHRRRCSFLAPFVRPADEIALKLRVLAKLRAVARAQEQRR